MKKRMPPTILVSNWSRSLMICGLLTLNSTATFGLTVISTHLQIFGEWTEVVGPDNDDRSPESSMSGTFSKSTSTFPTISHIVASEPYQLSHGRALVGAFDLFMEGDSAPNGMDVIQDLVVLRGTRLQMSAVTTTRFQSEASMLLFNLTTFADYNYEIDEQDMRVTLLDVTSSSVLLDLERLAEPPSFFPKTTAYGFNIAPTHIYELQISGWFLSFDSKDVEMSASVQLTEVAGSPLPVPDSTPVPFLFSLALSGLWLTRRVLAPNERQRGT